MHVPDRQLRGALAPVVGLPRLSEPRCPLHVRYFSPDAADRQPAEQFVSDIFYRHYGAHLRSFYPHLLSIENEQNDIVAVTGIRFACDEPLFSERYLPGRVETLGIHNPQHIRLRSNIVEVGNLAPAGIGQARWLIAALTAWLYHAGFNHVLFTAVPSLANAFTRLGLLTEMLAPADKQVLPLSEQSDWGTYYDSRPNVYIGNIIHGYAHLCKFIDGTMPRLGHLWHNACSNGACLNHSPASTHI